MVKNHQKRIPCPNSWKIGKKKNKYITKHYPCGHLKKFSLPLSVLIRDSLGFAKTAKEVKTILNTKTVQINSKRIKDIKKGIGLFDIISFPDIKRHFTIILDKKGNILPLEMSESAASNLMQKVTSKTINSKGKLQIGFFGGRTMQVEKDDYSTGDTVLIDLKKKKISKVLKFEKGSDIFLIDGKHIGKYGKVEDFDGRKLVFKDSKNQVFETLREYAIIVSDDVLKLLKSVSE